MKYPKNYLYNNNLKPLVKYIELIFLIIIIL